VARALSVEQENDLETGVASLEALAELVAAAGDRGGDLHLVKPDKFAYLLDVIAARLRTALGD
jgi:hypothetical protein